jgi:hypothetical protein
MPTCPLSLDEASAIALKALAFLAADGSYLQRFLALSGVSPAALAAQARNPAFQAGVLEHLLADEAMLLEFCANEAMRPDLPRRALTVLAAL